MADNVGFAKDEADADKPKNEGHPESIKIEEDPETVAPPSGPYAGMPKEVLLQYSRHPGYCWARDILTAIVVLTILILLSLVIAVVAISPSCLEFWQTSPMYEIYPKSFRRSNNDNGYGNINGITEKLGYVNGLGVSVISVNAMYESSRLETDYEITDFRAIDPAFGTMADMENLISSTHDEGMKIIVDFVPNHSSVKHPWFVASSNTSHPDHRKYKDYYVWADGSNSSIPPNNWMSVGGMGSAWTWNANREQYYYHAFSESQPDLNLRNKDVRRELQEILQFWLEKGVDGFRAIATSYMLEAPHLRDNPTGDHGEKVLHPDYTKHYKGNHDIVLEWKEMLDKYSTEPGIYRFLEIRDRGDIASVVRYYGTEIVKEASFPRNNILLGATSDQWNSQFLTNQILSWMKSIPTEGWPSWTIGDQGYSRVANRIGDQRSLLGMTLSMTLPGTPTVYYGDEIGMEDYNQDSKSLMLWNMEHANGFCGNCTPWNGEGRRNVSEATVLGQNDDSASMLSNYKRMITLRSEMVFQRGYLCVLGDFNGTLAYVRELSGLKSMLILLNFESKPSNVDLSNYIAASGVVDVRVGSGHSIAEGDRVEFSGLEIPPLAGFIVSFHPSDPPLNELTSTAGKCFIHSKMCYNSGLQVLQYC